MSERARTPTKAAFDRAMERLRQHGLIDRGFTLAPDGSITVHPVTKPEPANDYDRWKAQQ